MALLAQLLCTPVQLPCRLSQRIWAAANRGCPIEIAQPGVQAAASDVNWQASPERIGVVKYNCIDEL